MGFPAIPTTGGGRILTSVQANTTATRTFPSLSGLTKNAGDRLIAIVASYGSSTSPAFSSWGGGFTEIGDGGGASAMSIGIAEKISDGTETGTFTVTQATPSGHAVFILLSISGAHASTQSEAGAYIGALSGADPGAFDPAGWAAEDTLWIAVGACGETATTGSFTGVTAAPTNYSGFVATAISSDVVGGCNAAVAFRQLNASSENQNSFVADTSNARQAHMVSAVRGGSTNVAGTVASTWSSWTATATGTSEHTWFTASEGPYTSNWAVVIELNNDQLYEFRVAAVNSEGQAEWSNIPQETPTAADPIFVAGVISEDEWTSWGATAAGVVTAGGGGTNVTGTISSTWGGWTTSTPGTINHPAIITGPWVGAWTATGAATVNLPGTVASTWSSWTATGIATVVRSATIASTWSSWTATGIATVIRLGTVASTWSSWTATALAQAIQRNGTVASTWSSWTATGTAVVNRPASVSGTWTSWTATAAGTITPPGGVTGIVDTTWQSWTATALAQAIQRNATISTFWVPVVSEAIHPSSLQNVGSGVSPSTGVMLDSWQLIDESPESLDGGSISHNGVASTFVAYRLTDMAALTAVTAVKEIRVAWSRSGYLSGTSRLQLLIERSSDGEDLTDTVTVSQDANGGPTVTTVTPTLNGTGVTEGANILDANDWNIRFLFDANTDTITTIHAVEVVFEQTLSQGWLATGSATRSTGATSATTWSSWTATAVAQPLERNATIASNWSTWTATAGGGINNPAVIDSTWSSWTATAVAQPLTRNGSISGTWATWSATAIATVRQNATVSSTWTGWTATASATRATAGTSATTWSAWTATAIGTQLGQVPGSIDSTWNSWTATAVGTRNTPAVIAQSWSSWTATAASTVSHPATVSSTWTSWTATAQGTVTAETVTGTISSTWGTWTATATAQGIDHFGEISTTWNTWTATSNAVVNHTATGLSGWDSWTSTTFATVSHPATVATTWSPWSATAEGIITVPGEHIGFVDSIWSAWIATAIGASDITDQPGIIVITAQSATMTLTATSPTMTLTVSSLELIP
jgi:hypothetical protein